MEREYLTYKKTYLLVLVAFFYSFCVFAKKKSVVRRPPQFVIMSFDGSKSVNYWKETRDFAKEEGLKFTYFISGVMFLSNKDKREYKSPRHPVGGSTIGFGGTAAEIRERLEQVILAIKEGHEIGSHANGHFQGGHKWSYKEWLSEFQKFNSLIKRSFQRYEGNAKQAKFVNGYIDTYLKGFRAPFLAHNSAMLKVMKKMGFTYDASKLNHKNYWPEKIGGLWNFPIVKLRLAHSKKPTLSMDYDHFKAHSKAKNISYYSKKFEDDVVETYMQYFRSNYHGLRAPLNIGHHFSQWNKGVYWGALKRFAKLVCHMPEVKCTTYSKLVKFLEQTPKSIIKAYRRKNFELRSFKLSAN